MEVKARLADSLAVRARVASGCPLHARLVSLDRRGRKEVESNVTAVTTDKAPSVSGVEASTMEAKRGGSQPMRRTR